MTTEEPLAKALDDRIDRLIDSGPMARPSDLDTSAAPPELTELLEIAAALAELPRPDVPSDAFRRNLADRIRGAPPPSSLRRNDASVSLGATTQLIRALDAWLEGGEAAAPVESSVATELEPLRALASELQGLPGGEGPSGEFRQALAMRIASAPEPRAILESRDARAGWLRRLWRSTAFTAAAAATVLIFLAAGATYASAGTLPGHPLYGVKRAAESARLWLASGTAEMVLRMHYGDLRLDEAFASPDRAGNLLAEFSREATAALAQADDSVASGAPREAVFEPLLAWFLRTRARLVAGQRVLPPTALRGTLALVDEAIDALSEKHPLSAAPVSRLAPFADLLAARASTRAHERLAADRRLSRLDRSPPVPSNVSDASIAPPDTPETVVVVMAVESEKPDGGSEPPAAQAPPPSVGGQAPTPMPPAPRPTSKPPAPSTAAPPATSGPVVPTASVPPAPTEPPATDPATVAPLPTDPPTPAPTGTDVPVSTPTQAVLNKPPTVFETFCDEPVLKLYGATTCHVVAVDPEGAPLHYLWVSDAPQMVNERQKDAVYYAAWGIGGGTMRVGITVYVSDQEVFEPGDAGVVRGETHVDVRSPDAQGR